MQDRETVDGFKVENPSTILWMVPLPGFAREDLGLPPQQEHCMFGA